jgi:hypothetical protein
MYVLSYLIGDDWIRLCRFRGFSMAEEAKEFMENQCGGTWKIWAESQPYFDIEHFRNRFDGFNPYERTNQ